MTQCHDFTCGNHGKAGEKFDAAKHCRKCYGAARNPDLARSLGRPVLFPAPRPAAKPEPIHLPLLPACRWEGRVLEGCTSCNQAAREGNHVRECRCESHDATRCTRGVNSGRDSDIASCLTCEHHSYLVRVPEPPPIPQEATRHRCVVTVATGELGNALHSVSRPWMEAYARRLDADFVVLRWPGTTEWPMSCKFQFGRVFDQWERAIFLDADTLADPHQCPDLFAEVQPNEVGIFDDLPGLRRINAHRVILGEYQQVRLSQGMSQSTPAYYGNTGVIVASSVHRKVFDIPAKPIAPLHCAEQHLWIARMIDARLKVRFLHDRCNWQWWLNGKFEHQPPADAILHFSGMHERRIAARVELMKRFVCRHF